MRGALGIFVLGVVLIGCWFVGTERAGAGHNGARPVKITDAKRDMLWDWYRTSGAKCIAQHEGGWTSNTGNGYYGRFQANLDFQRGYGQHYAKRISYLRRWGTANHWPKWAQIHMARHGWQARGWAPWPNTARVCGLL